MSCQKCNSQRILSIYAKHNDLYVAQINGHEYEGYGINIPGLGGGDDLQFNVCLDCGTIQGTFPVPELPLEQGLKTSAGSMDDLDEYEIEELREQEEAKHEKRRQTQEDADWEAQYYARMK